MRAVIPSAILILAIFLPAMATAPARAGELWQKAPAAGAAWRAIHDAIYERENQIAYLEADPQTDDGYKAPIIAQARAEIGRLRAKLARPQWRWTTPCCYSRRPIYIR